MKFDEADIENAYRKLKSYIYYDNTDILLRRQLVEFETNTTKGFDSIFEINPEPYENEVDFFSLGTAESEPAKIVEKKISEITKNLNLYHKSPKFFETLLGAVSVNFYPKKYQGGQTSSNFVSNKRLKHQYPLERLTAFINAPIELHILSVLWIEKHGVKLDAKLDNCCLGNRLLLNKDKTKLVQGSGLFKPYFKQYQKWRDDSVSVAQELLKSEKDVLFLNLDIKDYFHSVRIPNDKLFKGRKRKAKIYQAGYNLEEIMLKLHLRYTSLVSSEFCIPYDFSEELETDIFDDLKEFILPIGLLSSYVLANDYLAEFDKRILERYKPAYFGRYVDDMLLVIADPNPEVNKNETNNDFKFSFDSYVKKLGLKEEPHYSVSFSEKSLNKLEEYVLTNLCPLINLVDSPFNEKYEEPEGRVFKLNGYKSLFCQSEKSLLYYFDSEESDLVIDKLKKELESRTSEFRDLPNDDESLGDFENSAYHLHYTGTEGKIRTLKDYKENRYGLTIYLSNQIFSALRHERKISEDEKQQILKFFKGENCLKFYRLWERVFTFFIVNDQPQAYVDFYLHCADQIDKIGEKGISFVHGTKVDYSKVRETLVNYLDCANEIAISLNPNFTYSTKEVERNFEFKTNELTASSFTFFIGGIEPTRPDSFWLKRFRKTNMIRHQYVVIPMMSYTTKSREWSTNLVSNNLDLDSFILDDDLVKNSPRPLKFWECCVSTTLQKVSEFKRNTSVIEDDRLLTNILGPYVHSDETGEVQTDEIYLDLAYELYLKGNSNHLPDYILSDESHRDNFYQYSNRRIGGNIVDEFHVNSASDSKLEKPRISFANTAVDEDNIVSSLRGEPNVSASRYHKMATILKQARKEKSEIILFPECFTPVNLLSSLIRFSEKNESLLVTGLEHITKDSTSFNFVVSVLPFTVNGINDATVLFRLKNHYSHGEEHLIRGNHLNVPTPEKYKYDLVNWRNVYFSTFYCFELANVEHRSLMKGKVDLLIGVEWNKDTNYFSNIVESTSRDLHCYIAQVNTSQYGDTRLTQPTDSARRDLLKLKGGINDAILVSQIDIPKLREFQRQKYTLTKGRSEFKPLPPDFKVKFVLRRIRNENVLPKRKDPLSF